MNFFIFAYWHDARFKSKAGGAIERAFVYSGDRIRCREMEKKGRKYIISRFSRREIPEIVESVALRLMKKEI